MSAGRDFDNFRGRTSLGPMTPAPSRRFLFVVSSARRGGNSEQLARRAAHALPATVPQEWLHLADHPLPPFADHRHTDAGPWTPVVEGPARLLLEASLAATDVVLVAPVYWYSLPAAAKLYLDHWTAWLRAPGWDFKARMAGKTLRGISVSSDGDAAGAGPLQDTLRLTADYMGMRWGGLLIGAGNRPGEVLQHGPSVAAADRFLAEPGRPA